jgi:hypothetical protein
LTWHEWGLYLLRAVKDTEDRQLNEELEWAKWRELYALLCNINRDPKKKPDPFKGTDFIKLSFDEVEEKQVKEIDQEYLERLKKRYSKRSVNGSK